MHIVRCIVGTYPHVFERHFLHKYATSANLDSLEHSGQRFCPDEYCRHTHIYTYTPTQTQKRIRQYTIARTAENDTTISWVGFRIILLSIFNIFSSHISWILHGMFRFGFL